MIKIQRREFLRRVALASAGAGVMTLLPSCRFGREVSTRHVAVVGAGLAGLTAAYELQQAGWEVTVLEAQDRVGGRVYTIRDGFAEGQYAEAGGEFIDGPRIHRQMHHYIRTFDLRLSDVRGGAVAYYLNQQRFRQSEVERHLGADVAADIDRFWEELEGVAEQIDDPTNPTTSAVADEFDTQSVAEWLAGLNLADDAHTIVAQYIRSAYGDPEATSLLFVAQSEAVYLDASESQIEIYRIEGGNDLLPQAMAAALERPVMLNSPVSAIACHDDGVTITHANGEVEAAFVVLTAPLTALRRVNFDPALPPELQTAIDELGYATHTKVLLQYSEKFWRDLRLSGETITDLPVGFTWVGSHGQDGDGGHLAHVHIGQGWRRMARDG